MVGCLRDIRHQIWLGLDKNTHGNHRRPQFAWVGKSMPEKCTWSSSTWYVVVVLTLTRIIKSVVTGQAPVTLELRNTLGEITHNPRWYTHISQLTQFMLSPEAYKSEIESQSTMCQVQAGAYVSLLTPGETNYSDCHPRKTNTYILHVLSITTHTHDRRKSIGEKKQRK